MASFQGEETSLSALLECSICQENKKGRDPKTLHCGHSFCCECLKSWLKQMHQIGKLECPMCSYVTDLPPEGVHGLSNDFKTEQFNDAIEKFKGVHLCQACLSKGRYIAPVVICTNCDRRLCKDCHEFHISSSELSGHRIVPFEHTCTIHGSQFTKICLTCFTGVCLDCLLSQSHVTHDVRPMKHGIRESKKVLSARVADLECDKSPIFEEYEHEIQRKLESFEKQVKEGAENMKSSVDKQVSKVIDQFRQAFQEEVSKNLRSLEEKQMASRKDLANDINASLQLVKDEYVSKLPSILEKLNTIPSQQKDDLTLPEVTGVTCKLTRPDCLPATLGLFHSVCLGPGPASQLILAKPKLVFEKLSITCRDVGLPRSLEVLSDGSAVVAFEKQDHVPRFDTELNCIARYYLSGSGEANQVNKLATHHDDMYILCWDDRTMIKIPAGTFQKEKRQISGAGQLKQIRSFAFDEENKAFLFSQFPPDGKTFKCKFTDLEVAECPLESGYIRVLQCFGKQLVTVAQYGAGTVRIYDSKEKLLRTLHGFHNPTDVLLVDMDTLLVVDVNGCISAHRISDGSLLKSILTKEDGLFCPFHAAFSYPYLWVVGRWRHIQADKIVGSLQLYKWE